VVFFTMALLAKEICVALIFVLIVIDFYPLRRTERRGHILLEKIPFGLLALLSGILAIVATWEIGELKSLQAHGLPIRLAQASFGLCFYLLKTLFPIRLSPIYPFPEQIDLSDFPYFVCALMVLVTSAGSVLARKRWPAAPAVWFSYCLLLLPVLGTMETVSLANDRFSYLSCMSWALALGGLILLAKRTNSSSNRLYRISIIPLSMTLLILLALLARKQSAVWNDSRTLWTHTIRAQPGCAEAYNNKGVALRSAGVKDLSFKYVRRALSILPHYEEAHVNLGDALADAGNIKEALMHYQEAIHINPDYVVAYNRIGMLLAEQGKATEAITLFRKAIEYQPSDAEAHHNLGVSLARQGDMREALAHFTTAITHNPLFPDAYRNRGLAYQALGEQDLALRDWMRLKALDQEAYRVLEEKARGTENKTIKESESSD
jgi:tetratricopeptide (TPR) repeat protein